MSIIMRTKTGEDRRKGEGKEARGVEPRDMSSSSCGPERLLGPSIYTAAATIGHSDGLLR
jgi:hypothetical protein